jgi:hypothetical protein
MCRRAIARAWSGFVSKTIACSGRSQRSGPRVLRAFAVCSGVTRYEVVPVFVTVYRWVQRFTPLLAEAARPCRHAVGDRWQADET